MEKLSNRETGELCLAETAGIQEKLSAWDCESSLVRTGIESECGKWP